MWARWLVSLLLLGCSEDPALECGPGVDQRSIEGRGHVYPPAMVTYRDNPPASGDHYFVPAAWICVFVQLSIELPE
jgi:hypothetical protein